MTYVSRGHITRDEAQEIALNCYAGSPTSAEIIFEMSNSRNQEMRFRLSRALNWLDPLNHEPPDPPGPRPDSEVDKLCDAIRYSILGHDRLERLQAVQAAMALLADVVRQR